MWKNTLLLPAPLFTRGCHSGYLRMFELAKLFYADPFPDKSPLGFVSPPGIKLGIFYLSGNCVNRKADFVLFQLCLLSSQFQTSL